jgi:hypothetical protein
MPVASPLVTEQAALTVWGVSLVIGLVVIAVVGLLLYLILRTAKDIEQAAGAIWVAGQRVANNTVHIPLLSETNRAAAALVNHAVNVDRATELIEQHAVDCPGCPQCVLGRFERGPVWR